jgi:hypothetical protein
MLISGKHVLRIVRKRKAEKMGDLNSVLIEGEIDDIYEGREDGFTFRIQVQTKRIGMDGKKVMTEYVYPVIHAEGHLADDCSGRCAVGCKVRIVGRLKNYSGSMDVCADHIEIKPVF